MAGSTDMRPSLICATAALPRKAEPASAGFVEVVGLESVCPGALVVFFWEVAGAGPGEEGFPDARCVLLVARAPG